MFKNAKIELTRLLRPYNKKFNLDLPYFIKNGFWSLIRQFGTSLIGLVFYVIFARISPKEVFGEYQLITSILGIVSIVSITGFGTATLRAGARGQDGDYKRAVNKSFLWSLLGTPLLLGIGLYFYYFRNREIALALMLCSLFFPLIYPFKLWDTFLQGKSLFKTTAFYSMFLSVASHLFLVWAIFFDNDNLILLIFIYLLANSTVNILLYLTSKKYIKNNRRGKGMIKYGYFLTKLNVLGTLASNIDKILTGIFLSSSQLAVYSVGIIFTSQIQNISKSLLGVAVPKYITHKRLPRDKYFRIFIGSIILTGFLMLFFKFAIPLLFEQKYAESIILSIISIAFYPFYVLSTLYRNQFLFTNKKVVAGEAIIFQIFKILATIIVLPIWGIKGLAFIFGFQYVVVCLSLFVLGKIYEK